MRVPVVVVGAGPAGSTAAYHIPNRDVLIIDRKRFPREKSCGGGLLNARDWHKIFPNFAEIKDQIATCHSAEDIEMYWNEKPIFFRKGHIFDHVRRKEFDYLLLNAALRKSNVSFRCFNAASIERRDGKIIISNGRDEIISDVVIGCDGWDSVVSRHLGNKPPNLEKREYGTCFEYDITCAPIGHTRIMFAWKQEVGYAWVFPTSTGCYVGVMCIGTPRRPLKEYVDELVQFCLGCGIIHRPYWIERRFGAPDPIHVPRTYYAGNNMLLAGDAMGLVKQITGEGIFFAMLSGMIAGQVIERGGEIAIEYANRIAHAVKEVTFLRNVPPRTFMMPALRAFALLMQYSPIKRVQLQDAFLNALCRRRHLPEWSAYQPFGATA